MLHNKRSRDNEKPEPLKGARAALDCHNQRKQDHNNEDPAQQNNNKQIIKSFKKSTKIVSSSQYP